MPLQKHFFSSIIEINVTEYSIKDVNKKHQEKTVWCKYILITGLEIKSNTFSSVPLSVYQQLLIVANHFQANRGKALELFQHVHLNSLT